MTLDSRFVIASDLQSVFVDDNTGLPLASGTLRFWKDQARTIPKPVYTITGTPPDYTYVNLGAEINLSLAGTPTDNNGHDIILYYFPYEGTLDDTSNKPELYYVEALNENGQTIFTRQGWPNFTLDGDTSIHLDNFAPNGQFLVHTDVPATSNNQYTVGQVTQPVTQIAQGGWTFERPVGSTSKDIVIFQPFVSAVNSPSANPKFALRIQCQSPSAGDAYKDVRLTFKDVNKFASDTQKYTYAFSGKSNTGSSLTASLILRKNFGTGGSPSTETVLANITIPGGSYDIVQTQPFIFGTNIGKTISTLGDDNVQLILRLPTDAIFDVSVTNFELLEGAVTVVDFPATTNAQFQYESMPPGLPNTDGSSYFLPMVLAPTGFIYDSSVIGEVVYESNPSTYVNSLHPSSNKMLADGSKRERLGFSPLGIPYNRLFQAYWNSTLNLPVHGTGPGYFIAYFSLAGNVFRVINNSGGIVTDAADGTPATGFTFKTVHKVQAPSVNTYYCKAYMVANDEFYIEANTAGAVAPPNVGTSGFGVSVYQVGVGTTIKQIIHVQPSAAAGLAGKYFEFNQLEPTLTTVTYYVWFKVDGTGTDPVPGAANPILVDLDSTDTAAIVAQKIREALNAWQITEITTVAASTIPAGAYFSINSTEKEFYVWYRKDNAGTDPKPSNKTAIVVDIVSADTNAQVAVKTQQAINRMYFGVPDYRGYILRGWDNGAGNDPETGERYSLVPGISGDMVGTFQLTENLYHAHEYEKLDNTAPLVVQAGTDQGQTLTPTSTEASGGPESRPPNKNVNIAIRY